jgi:hypothetical protein
VPAVEKNLQEHAMPVMQPSEFLSPSRLLRIVHCHIAC